MSAEQPDDQLLDSLFSRLQQTLGDLAPEPLLDRMKPVMEGFLGQFQLVPKQEYDAHMAALARLEDTVAELEGRLDALTQTES